MAEYSIGIDLGGTNLRAAAIDRSGKMIRKIAGSTDLSAGREAVVADMVASIRKLRDQCGADSLEGVGVGVPVSSSWKRESSRTRRISRASKTFPFATRSNVNWARR